MLPWWALFGLHSDCIPDAISLSQIIASHFFKIVYPKISSTGARSSNELQRLDTILSCPSNGYRATYLSDSIGTLISHKHTHAHSTHTHTYNTHNTHTTHTHSGTMMPPFCAHHFQMSFRGWTCLRLYSYFTKAVRKAPFDYKAGLVLQLLVTEQATTIIWANEDLVSLTHICVTRPRFV